MRERGLKDAGQLQGRPHPPTWLVAWDLLLLLGWAQSCPFSHRLERGRQGPQEVASLTLSVSPRAPGGACPADTSVSDL